MRFLVPLVAAAFIADCGGGSDATAPKTPTVATVALSETAITIEAGFSKQIYAVLKTATDSVLTGIPVTWLSDNPAVATVVNGIIEALSVGSTKITATASGKSAAATLSVIPTVVMSIKLSRTTAALAPGKMLQLTADPLDVRERVIPGRTVTFASSDNSIADVSATGLVTTKAVGIATMIASSGDKQAQLTLTVALPSNLSIAIQGRAPGSFLQLTSYSIKIRHADDSLSATGAINAPMTLSGSMVLADSVEFLASATGAPSMASRVIASRTQMPTTVPVVFIPQTVTIPTGTFAGVPVGINLIAAVAPCLVNSDQCRNGFYGTAFSSGVKRWPSFPIPVSMDLTLDTASIWASLRAMEAAAGQKLFVLNDSSINRINVKLGLPTGVSGFAGYTTWTWDVSDRMTFATVSFASPTPGRGLVQHEFLHALGFWHTCSWNSVMGGYGCPQALEISSFDIAYLLLANAVYDTESGVRLPNGQLPCGLMSLWAAIPNQTVTVRCFGSNSILPNTVIRQESAP